MKTFVILTTINEPSDDVKELARGCTAKGWPLIVCGDEKTPKDWSVPGATFLPIEKQLGRFAEMLVSNNYARKNMGYLYAIQHGAECIIETDDDNCPQPEFFQDKNPVRACVHYIHKNALSANKWVNIYKFFTHENVWPRGFPLELIRQQETNIVKVNFNVHSTIHQGLADGDPDVDAVYRLTSNKPIIFNKGVYALEPGLWCPWNSQNTSWWPNAFPLLYIPEYCSRRVEDIVRSFVAQRILWEWGQSIVFHSATMFQERNEHDLLDDFKKEVPGFLNYSKIADKLDNLNLYQKSISTMMYECYGVLIDVGVIEHKELDVLSQWLKEVEQCQNPQS